MTKEEIIKIAVQASKEYDKDHNKEQIINMRAVDALDSFDACDNEAYIESIKKSTVRTKIILTHINEILRGIF